MTEVLHLPHPSRSTFAINTFSLISVQHQEKREFGSSQVPANKASKANDLRSSVCGN